MGACDGSAGSGPGQGSAIRLRTILGQPVGPDRHELLFQRLALAGESAVSDLELLEMVLAGTRGGASVARALLDRFGSFADAVQADPDELAPFAGNAAIQRLQILRAAAIRLSREQIAARPLLACWQSVVDYCRTTMAYGKTRQYRTLFLDAAQMLIADEPGRAVSTEGLPLDPGEVVRRALDLGATALILVHNLPTVTSMPSELDIRLTASLHSIAEACGVTLQDHLSISRETHMSFRHLGLI